MENTTLLMSKKRVNILGVNVDSLSMKETVSIVEHYVEEKKFLHLMGVNADKVLQCIDNTDFRNIVNLCGVINADGISLVMASKFLNCSLPERVAGIDLMIQLLASAEKKNNSVYLLGATQDAVEKTFKNIKLQYPELNVVGYRNGYFEKKEWKSISNELKQISPDFIFVGITSPLKEELIYYFEQSGNKGVFMGVGGSFDVLSGNIKRAPEIVQRLNLEWLFRVCQEPKRLFKRYLFGNIRFIYLIVREKIRR